MGGSSTQSTNSTTTASPWDVQAPYLAQGFSDAKSALGQANTNATNPNYAAPTEFTAGLVPSQIQTFQNMAGFANNAPALEGAYGGGALNGGGLVQGATANALNNYNPFAGNNIGNDITAGNAFLHGANIPAQVNAAMFPAIQAAEQVTLPGIAGNATIGGNTNNSRSAIAQGLVQQGLGEQAQSLAANLEGQYYNQGANLAANANASNNFNQIYGLNTEAQLGNQLSSLGLGALGQSIGNQGQIYGIQGEGGSGLQSGAQAQLQNQLQGYNFGQQSPFEALQNYWNIVGSGSWGGTSNTQGTTTYTPSMMSQIGGIAGAAGSLMGKGGGGMGGLLAM